MQHLRDALKPIVHESEALVCCPEGQVVGSWPFTYSDEDVLRNAPIKACNCCGNIPREDLWVRRKPVRVYTPQYVSVHREDLEKLLDCWEAHNVH